jgi:transcriptional regulator with XRE-family HTH domain
MAKSVKALINPAMLAWARAQSGFSPDEAARRLHIDEERLSAFEQGAEAPTFAKLLDIADLYKRPVSLFYLKAPPKGWQPIQDFRRLLGHRIFGRYRDQHVNVIGHQMSLLDPALLPSRQIVKHLAQMPFDLAEKQLLAVLRRKHDDRGRDAHY